MVILGQTNYFIEVPVQNQESGQSCICVLRESTRFSYLILNCSDSLVFFVFHFYLILIKTFSFLLAHLTTKDHVKYRNHFAFALVCTFLHFNSLL